VVRRLGSGVASGVAILVACTLVATACSSDAPTATGSGPTTTAPGGAGTRLAATTCHRPHRPGQSSQAFTFHGKRRTYLLYVPKSYRGTSQVPLVFNFHGYGSNAAQQMALANFGPIADKNNFLVVAPDGQDRGGRHWSFGNEPGLQNDVKMVAALLKRLEGKLCVDAQRVYSTGMSDGGAMTSVLACTSADKFAAFAAVSVVIYCANRKGRAVPIESYAGSKDPIVPTGGGRVTCCGNPTLPSKASTMAKWAKHNHCRAAYSDTKIKPHVLRRTWRGCKPGSATVYYLVKGDGHTWPGGPSLGPLGHATKEISATKRMWDFFAAHRLSG
jgi:polyhydroxybutyrate depolymerase